MAAPFDPFCEWLEIEPHEHPVDHYRLLGLRRFESDPEMIEAAADERMKKIRSFQTGPRGRFTQPILNALSQARLCLADLEERASYDGQLRSAEQVESEQPEGLPVAETAFGNLYWSVDDLGISERSMVPWIVAAVVLVAAVGIGLIIRQGQSGTDPPGEPKENQQKVVKKNPREKPKPKRVLVQQEATGEVHLSPSTAELVGGNMQRDPDKTEVYGWKETSDLVRWSFRIVAKPGPYMVKVEYSADEQWEGGEYNLQLDDAKASFMDVVPGESSVNEKFLFIRSTGPHTLTLRASRITGDELMRLRSIELVPSARE